MKAQTLLRNRGFLLAVLLSLALLAGIVTAEIRAAGEPQTVNILTDVAAVACALIAAVAYLWAWRSLSAGEASKQIWGLVALGMVLWTIAEAIWAYYELILKIETPYPSLADLFWLVGYIPLYAALVRRYRSFQAVSSARQRLAALAFSIVYTAILALYVIRPILEAFDSVKLLESLTNMAYPVADWGLLVLTLAIIFALEKGRFAAVWRLFGFGLILTATADILYFYTTWNGLYYPDGQLNALSALTDGLYNASYLTMGLAILAYVFSARGLAPAEIHLSLKSPDRVNFLVFVDSKGRILSLSDNFASLVGAPTTRQYVGTDLATGLGVHAGELQQLLIKTAERGSVSHQRVALGGPDGQSREAWLTSVAIYDEEKQFDIGALVLQTNASPAGEAPKALSEEQKTLVEYYLSQVGSGETDDKRVMKDYFLKQMNLLYSLIQQFSGTQVAGNLLSYLNQLALQNRWQFSYAGQDLTIPDDLEGPALAELLRRLLHEGRKFAADITDRAMIEQETMSLELNLGSETREYVDKYDLRGVLQPAT